MDRLQVSQPLADCVAIVHPMLNVQVIPQRTLSELRGSPAFRQDPTYSQLPAAPGRCQDHGVWRANWLRPDGWLLIEAYGSTVARDTFAEATHRKLCRIVDLSHGLTCISLHGAAAPALLARGSALDLRPQVFGPGCCTRTRCADFTVMLERRPAGIDVYVDTSLAQALWNWIADAAENSFQ